MADNRAQYAIDIAATMVSGDETSAQLDVLTQKLMGGGKDAEHFQQAIQQVGRELKIAQTIMGETSAALALGETRYAQLEKAALKSAREAQKAALKNGGIVPKELFDEAERAAAALKGEAVALDQLRAAASKAGAEEKRLSAVQKNLTALQSHTNRTLGDATSKISALQGALGDIGGPLGRLGQAALRPVKAFSELREKFGATTATLTVLTGVTAAAASAIAGLVAISAAGLGVITGLGIALANNTRNTALATEAWNAMYPELESTSDAMSGITRDTGATTERLRALTGQLTAAKVSADDMPAALRAVATAEAALGQEGAAKFIEEMKAGKKSVDELADEVQSKFGGLVAKQMLGLGAQGARLKGNLASLFGGLDIEPLLMGFTTLVNLFDQTTVAGETMKFLFETLVQPIVDGLTAAIPLAEAFFLGFLIGALKIYIGLKPAIKAVKEFLGFDDPTTADTFLNVKNAGEVVAKVLAYAIPIVLALGAAFTVMSIASGAVALVTAAIASPILLTVAAIAALGTAVYAFWPEIKQAFADGSAFVIGVFQGAVDWLKSIDMAQIGLDIVQGLASGIASAGGAVLAAITGVVGGAIDAAKSLLGIASPSKVFEVIGDDTATGYVKAVDASTPAVHAAVAGMVEPPANDNGTALGAATPLSRVSSPVDVQSESPRIAQESGGGGPSIDLSGASFTFHGVKDAEQAEQRFGELLTRILEGDLTQSGGQAGDEAEEAA